MPISDHLISFHPRLIADIDIAASAIAAENALVSSERAVEGARPDMVFLTRLLPSVQNQVSFTTFSAFCTEDDKVHIQYWGSGNFAHQVTVIGI